MTTKVFVCGVHSVGKTTLLGDVTSVTSWYVEPEVGRRAILELGLGLEDRDPQKHPDVFEGLQGTIMQEQSRVEQKLDNMGLDVYMVDRGPDALVYAWHYLGHAALDRLLTQSYTQDCLARYRESLMFVVEPHEECLQEDGLRIKPEMPDQWAFTHKLCALLSELHIPYHVISILDRQERVQVVLKTIREFKGGRQ